ncbi:MAG: FeoB-associated Cys-rich membrane protein [Lachnospiraceae bacterium]|nr:FeoB-associated Cys-rich membrane protein [Lachnospiraceae bacterium]
MINVIIIAALFIICVLIIRYLISEKKKGHCAGCSMCSGGGACEHYASEQKELKELNRIRAAKHKE